MIAELLSRSIRIVPYGIRPYFRKVPLVAEMQRWLVARHLASKPFIFRIDAGPARGTTFEISLPQDKGIWTGTYEEEFASAISRHVCRDDICYDIGGFRGYMTAVMAAAGASKVYVFEPLPKNQKGLKSLIQLNPALCIELVPKALGNSDGRLAFKVMPESSMGKLASSPFQSSNQAAEEIEVDVAKLDTLLANNALPPPQCMKIDVEGAEFEVLEGAQETLARHRPKIFMEIHSKELEVKCSRKLLSLNYSVQRLGRVPLNEEQPRHVIATS